MPELDHMTTPADREARKTSSWLFPSLQWEVPWEEGRLGMLVGWTTYNVSHTNSDLESEKRFPRRSAA